RVASGRNVVAREEILGECLGAFELRGDPARAEAAAAGSAETVDDAGNERRLGTDDGQRDVFAPGEFEQAVEVGRGNIDIADARFARAAGVARRDQHFAD